MSATITEADRAAARARAESIATRWVPAHMTARQGLVDDIAAALENAKQLGMERGEKAVVAMVEAERDDWLGEGDGDQTHWDVLNRLCEAIAARRSP